MDATATNPERHHSRRYIKAVGAAATAFFLVIGFGAHIKRQQLETRPPEEDVDFIRYDAGEFAGTMHDFEVAAGIGAGAMILVTISALRDEAQAREEHA